MSPSSPRKLKLGRPGDGPHVPPPTPRPVCDQVQDSSFFPPRNFPPEPGVRSPPCQEAGAGQRGWGAAPPRCWPSGPAPEITDTAVARTYQFLVRVLPASGQDPQGLRGLSPPGGVQARAPALPGVVLASPWTVPPESAHSLSLGGAHRQGTCPCPQMESKLPLPWAPLAVLFTCPAGGGSPRQVQTGVQGGLGSEGETPVSWVIRQVRGVLPSVLRTAREAPAGLTLLDTCPVASPRSTALTPRAALGRPRGPWAWSPGPVPSPQPEPIPFVRLAPLPAPGENPCPSWAGESRCRQDPQGPTETTSRPVHSPDPPPSCGPHPQGTSPPCAKTLQVTSGAPPSGRPPLSPPPPAQRALSLLSLFR